MFVSCGHTPAMPEPTPRSRSGQIAESIERFGFTNPVLIAMTARSLPATAGLRRQSCSAAVGAHDPAVPPERGERRAYVLADNKLALNAGWDNEILAIELQGARRHRFRCTADGLQPAEVDLIIDEHRESDPDGSRRRRRTPVPEPPVPPVTPPAIVWLFGRHRLLCGDADARRYRLLALMASKADLVFTDPPYNVADRRQCLRLGLGQASRICHGFAAR